MCSHHYKNCTADYLPKLSTRFVFVDLFITVLILVCVDGNEDTHTTVLNGHETQMIDAPHDDGLDVDEGVDDFES
jgi:hypothetical protein